MKRIGLRPSAFDELRKQKGFPKPAYLNRRTPIWMESEIDQWLAERFEQRAADNDNDGDKT